jgi:hypothetical protein
MNDFEDIGYGSGIDLIPGHDELCKTTVLEIPVNVYGDIDDAGYPLEISGFAVEGSTVNLIDLLSRDQINTIASSLWYAAVCSVDNELPMIIGNQVAL